MAVSVPASLPTVTALLLARAGRPEPGLAFQDRRWSWQEHVSECARYAAALRPGLFAGYYGDAEADASRMRDGRYWSGDLGYADARGFCWFAGRAGQWLRVDGENLGTAPIERALLRHPAIAEAAVYGVPDPGEASGGHGGVVPPGAGSA